jgi:Carboxypeptidase regulatory-like domain
MLAFVALILAQIVSQPAVPQTPQGPARDARPVAEGTGIIRGRVVVDDTGEPVRGCRVMLMKGGPGSPRDAYPAMAEPLFARTNEDGSYQFTRLAPGTYRLMAAPEMSSPRYVSPMVPGPGTPFGKPIELAEGQKVTAPELKLSRGGVLAGRVIDEFGEPVAYVRVNPLMRMGGGEPRQMGMSMNGTDDLGRFRLFGLRAGEYYLVAEPQNFGPPTENVRHLSTYHPSALTLAEATPIRLRAGEEIGDLEIRLTSGRTFTISGSILTSKGQPFSRRHGSPMFVESKGGGVSGTGVEVREDGTFHVRGVKPGTYSIEIQPHMRHPDDDVPADAEFGSLAITVSDADVEGVMVVTQPGASVAGVVAFDEPPTSSSPPFYVTAMPAAGMGRPFGLSGRAQVAPDGTFTLRGLFRPVYLRVMSSPDYHLASVVLDGQDITDTPTEFKAGKSGRLVVSLSRRLSELSGHVRVGQGRTDAAIVVVLGEERALWTSHASTTKYATVDDKGNYRIAGLRQGRYLAIAVPAESRPPMFDDGPEAWEALARNATAVTIGDQERKTLDLELVTERDP